MATFQDYLKGDGNKDYAEKQLKIIDKILLSKDTSDKVKSIEKDIKILTVAEVYCPDCRAIIPFLEKFSSLNNRITVVYSTRDESHDLLIKATGEARIPTLFLDNGTKVKPIFTEFPQTVRRDMKENPEKYDEIKYNFRTGKYNRQIEEELLSHLLSM